MKSYNIQNYIRYKNDVTQTIKRLPNLPLDSYTREELKREKELLNKQL